MFCFLRKVGKISQWNVTAEQRRRQRRQRPGSSSAASGACKCKFNEMQAKGKKEEVERGGVGEEPNNNRKQEQSAN